MADKLIDRIIDVDNRIADSFDKYTWFYKFRKKFIAGKRVGFQLLDEDGKVVEEYTITTGEHPHIKGYEEGINDVWFTEGAKVSVLEEMLEDEQDFIDKPLKSTLKYLPKCIKYLINGDITIGKK